MGYSEALTNRENTENHLNWSLVPSEFINIKSRLAVAEILNIFSFVKLPATYWDFDLIASPATKNSILMKIKIILFFLSLVVAPGFAQNVALHKQEQSGHEERLIF